MFTLPIATFYFCYEFVFYQKPEPANWSGAAAVLVTNLIIVGYVWMAFSEPDDEDEKEKRGNEAVDNDVNYPRTGIFKQRTD